MPARAVDTTGAGDAFAGGLARASRRALRWSRPSQLALVTAAISVERDGCQPSYPRRDEVAERAAAVGIDVRLPTASKNDEGAGGASRAPPAPPQTPSSRLARR